MGRNDAHNSPEGGMLASRALTCREVGKPRADLAQITYACSAPVIEYRHCVPLRTAPCPAIVSDGSQVPAAHRRGRRFQFGMKYWVGCTGTMAGVLITSQDIPSLRQWNPLYLTFTMVVILSEKARTVPTAPRLRGQCVKSCAGGI